MSNLLERLLQEQKEEEQGNLYMQTQIMFAYHSCKLEGNELSEEQVRDIYENNSFSVMAESRIKVNDITEIINHFTCFDYMISCASEDLTENMMKQFHQILKRNTLDELKGRIPIGVYKTEPNTAGGTKATAPEKVDAEISQLLKDYLQGNKEKDTSLEAIADFHYRFERIHPFADNNGKIGRLIMFKECLKNSIMPFIIAHRQKLYYFRGLQTYRMDQAKLLNVCLAAQNKYDTIEAYFSNVTEFTGYKMLTID